VKKVDIINRIAQDAGITKTAAKRVVNSIVKGMTAALAKGDKVTLSGFGVFNTYTRKARRGRDPRRGTAINIPAKKVPRFKASDELKKKMR
jgi:DNA-binding protein HU-beta